MIIKDTPDYLFQEIEGLRRKIEELRDEVVRLELKLAEQNEYIELLENLKTPMVRVPFEGTVR